MVGFRVGLTGFFKFTINNLTITTFLLTKNRRIRYNLYKTVRKHSVSIGLNS